MTAITRRGHGQSPPRAAPQTIEQRAHGVGMAVIGAAAGAVAAVGLTRLMTSQLFGVAPRDPLTFAAVAVVLLVVAAAACCAPARRAMRV
ncbi:MAG: hypothetical protein ACRD1V_18805, partial [Vicinamibacterales bacterium]